MIKWGIAGALALLAAGSLASCDDDDDEGVGSSCSEASQCYSAVRDEVQGAPVCLDRVQGGYCTHNCSSDDDCCAVAGECPNGREQVCGPFESTGLRLCFLSCEEQSDADAYCARHAQAGFTCRSTGGGAQNRKVCVP
jgi:hypothetical protein